MFDKLVDLLLASLRFIQFCDIVWCYQDGVILRVGKFHRLAPPGFHWFIPFHIEKLLTANVVLETVNLQAQSLITKDQKSVVLEAVISFEVRNIRKFLLDIEGGNQVLEDSSYGIIGDYVLANSWQQLCEGNLAIELTKLIRKEAFRWGVEVVKVQLATFTMSRSLRLITSYSYTEHKEV